MPTIIDSLLVRLGMDKSDYDKGRKDVSKSVADLRKEAKGMGGDFKKASKDTGEGFETMAKAAAKFLAVVGGTVALKDFIEDTIASSAALERFAENIEKSITDVSAWGQAVEHFGGTAEGLQGTLSKLSQAQTDLMLTGQSGLIPYFSALGVNLRDAGGGMSILLHLADNIHKVAGRQNQNNILRSIGLDQGTANVVLEGRGATELMIKRIKETTAATKAQGDAAKIMYGHIVDARQVFEALGRTLVFDATPAIERIIKAFNDLGNWLSSHKTLVEGTLTVIGAAIGAIAIAAIPINAVVLAIGGLGVALGAAYEDYKVWENGGRSLFNWAPAVNATNVAFRLLRDTIREALFSAAHFGAALMFLWDGDFKSAGAMISMATEGSSSANSDGSQKSDRQKFIASAADKLGVPPEAIDAQLRLETHADGSGTIGKFNYGNIKASPNYSGDVELRRVKEKDSQGREFTELSRFRSYGNVDDAANDYAATIASRFPGAVGAKTAGGFARGLQAGGYATDPDYVRKISNIATGIVSASQTAGAAQDYASQMRTSNTNDNSSRTVSIGQVVVNSAASDASGISSDIGNALNYQFVSQLNYGIK